MAIWSRNHRACETTWTTLYALTQLREAFPQAGDIPMQQLTFWTQSGDSRDVRARTLATQMDRVFVRLRGATYEDGANRTGAVSELVSALVSKDKSIAQLAEVADAQYRFWGEEALADPDDEEEPDA